MQLSQCDQANLQHKVTYDSKIIICVPSDWLVILGVHAVSLDIFLEYIVIFKLFTFIYQNTHILNLNRRPV